MSDLAYFQGLYDAALDFTMQAHWGQRIKELNGGVMGPCQHTDTLPYFDRSYGILYSWEVCQGCGKELHSTRLDGH